MVDVEKLKQRLREEITRTQAGVRLDLNLEKGRIRDESGQQELKIKEVDTRIESEIAGLRTQIEQAKFSILQYLVGVATGAGALLLAYMRLVVSRNPLEEDEADEVAIDVSLASTLIASLRIKSARRMRSRLILADVMYHTTPVILSLMLRRATACL